jgi:hypothetical protein
MGVAGGFEILGAFAGRFSCMELSEIEEACAKIGIQIQGKELIDKISDLKNSGHLKVYGYGKSIEVIATQKGREAYRDYRSFILVGFYRHAGVGGQERRISLLNLSFYLQVQVQSCTWG